MEFSLLSVGYGVFGILFLLAARVVVSFVIHSWKLRKFRGPFAMPFLGNCYSAETLQTMKYFAKLKKIYGKVYTFFALTKPYIVCADPGIARRVLSDPKTFIKGSDYSERFGFAFGEGLVTSNGDKHKRDRGIFNKYFIRSNIAKFTNSIDGITQKAMKDLLTGSEGKPCNIEDFFAALSLRVFMNFSMGTDHSNDREKEKWLCEKVSEGSNIMGKLFFLPIPLWNIFPLVKTIRTGKAIVEEDFRLLVEDRKQMMKEGKEFDDCLAAMLADNMTWKDMFDHYLTLICAGHDTTAYFSSYMCYLLSIHQDVQDRLYHEIRSAVEKKPEGSTLTADDVTEMKFLNKVMQETLRMFAIIPNVSRTCIEEVHIKEANITIPKNTNVMIPMFLLNRDPELWENPATFNPDRFADDMTNFTNARNGFFPFGYGTRTCIGNTLSQIESAIFLCRLMMKYRFDKDDAFKPQIMSGISLTTMNGINVVLSPR